MNTAMLRAKMVLHGDTQAILADYLGISLSRCNAKINEMRGAEFGKSEISKIRDRYHLTAEEVECIFFAKKVS